MVQTQPFSLGFILQFLDPDLVETIALAGIDYMVFCLEHTGKTIESAYPCLLAAYAHDVPALIRTADKDQYLIEQALDAGAQGVVVPMVETVEECENIVKAAKYAPVGTRGFCPTNALSRWMNYVNPDFMEYAKDANRDTFIVAMIESPKGFANLPEMVKVEGIDAFLLGPADYGLYVQKGMFDPEVDRIMTEATETITKAGKLCIPTILPGHCKEHIEKGARMGSIGRSVSMILQEYFGNAKKEILETMEEVHANGKE